MRNKDSKEIIIELGSASNCTKFCDKSGLPDLRFVSLCMIGSYSNALIIGNGSQGNYNLLAPFDRITETDIRECKG